MISIRRLAVAFILLIAPLLSQVVAAESASPAAYRDVLPAERGAIIAATGETISQYEIDARIEPETGLILGEQRVTFVNATADALGDIVFRLYPNADYYDEGDVTLSELTVAGQLVPIPAEGVDPTVLEIPLGEPLAPGDDVEIGLAFTTVVPLDSDGSYGILNRDGASDAWILADWYPIVAGYEQDAGWDLDPPTSFGDPTFGEVALYDVQIDAPDDWEIVSSGTPVPTMTGGQHHWIAGPARDFTLVANPGAMTTSGAINGTTVSVFAGSENETAADQVLTTALEAVEIYSELAGPYPYRELDIVTTPLAGAVGVAWAGIIFLDIAAFDPSPAAQEALRFTVAHEVGHQWWGGIIGVNSNDHTFMTEGLTNALTILFIEETAGESAAATALRDEIAAPYLALLDRSGDQVVDIPIAEGQQGRGAIWYGKAALGFLAIRQEVGDEAFRAAISSYGTTFAQRIADPSDLLAAFEEASGQALDELWRFWFESDEVTAAEVARVVERF
jgi:hypothetical protein